MRKNSEDGTSKTLDDANSPSPLLPADVSISSVSLLSRFLRFTSDETPCEISTCQRCQVCRSRCISIAPGSIANPRSLFSIVSPEDMLCLGGEKKSPWDLCPMIPSFGRGSSATRFRWPCVPPAPALSPSGVFDDLVRNHVQLIERIQENLLIRRGNTAECSSTDNQLVGRVIE